jgi:hypothetical protein
MAPQPLKFKVLQKQLQLIVELLVNYTDGIHQSLQNPMEVRYKREKLIESSIAWDLYFKYGQKLMKRSIPESFTLKLELHEALIIEKCLITFSQITQDVYKNAAADTIKNELNQKRISHWSEVYC